MRARPVRDSLAGLRREICDCRKCPRLVAWRERVSREKRAAFRRETYWGRAVPGFGDPRASLLIVGLAPAAHGANRTGRMFTGDGSADFLIPALHRAGFASQPESVARDDGLRLTGAWLTAAARCAPPDNHPTPAELANCRPYLVRELTLLREVRAILVLGGIALHGTLAALFPAGRRPGGIAFAHGAAFALPPPLPHLFCSYHPSRQNTQTGRLTAPMLDAVLRRVRRFVVPRPGMV